MGIQRSCHLLKLDSKRSNQVRHSGEENISKYFVYRGKNWRTSIHCIDGLGWAGLGAVISPLIYSGQMMNVSPVPVTLRRCSLLTGTQSLDPSHLQQQMNNWKMSVWPAPQFAVISQAVLAVTLFRKRLVPAFCSAENFKNLQNCSGHFRDNKLLCPSCSGVSAP